MTGMNWETGFNWHCSDDLNKFRFVVLNDTVWLEVKVVVAGSMRCHPVIAGAMSHGIALGALPQESVFLALINALVAHHTLLVGRETVKEFIDNFKSGHGFTELRSMDFTE